MKVLEVWEPLDFLLCTPQALRTCGPQSNVFTLSYWLEISLLSSLLLIIFLILIRDCMHLKEISSKEGSFI